MHRKHRNLRPLTGEDVKARRRPNILLSAPLMWPRRTDLRNLSKTKFFRSWVKHNLGCQNPNTVSSNQSHQIVACISLLLYVGDVLRCCALMHDDDSPIRWSLAETTLPYGLEW